MRSADYDKADRSEIRAQMNVAEENSREEVLASYRYIVLADKSAKAGLKETHPRERGKVSGISFDGEVELEA